MAPRPAPIRLGMALSFVLLVTAPARSDVVFDGSLGPGGRAPTGLTDQDFTIPAEFGELHGDNLFHSFGEFDLSKDQSARFTGPQDIRNVIARVTGDDPSSIDGTLRSDMTNANVYLVNPNGIVFGANAKLDVPRAFAATTADFVRFADGAEFHSSLSGASTLSAAAPESFGFLGKTRGRIDVQGSQLVMNSPLSGGPGSESSGALTLVAGDVFVDDATITTFGGDVSVVGVGDHATEVGVGGGALGDGPSAGGDVILRNSLVDLSSDSSAGGAVSLRAGQVLLVNSMIASLTAGESDGGDIDLQATGDLTLDNTAILTGTRGSGRGGNVRLRAEDVSIMGPLDGGKGVASFTVGAGDAGSIFVDAGHLSLENVDVLSESLRSGAGTEDSGAAGSIDIRARTAVLDHSTLRSKTKTMAGSGEVHVAIEGSLSLDHSAIQTESAAAGSAGAVTVSADSLSLGGDSAISARNFGSGAAGDVSISLGAGPLILMDHSVITASTNGGPGGNIRIDAPNSDVVLGFGTDVTASVDGGPGDGGNIDITARALVTTPVVDSGARITARAAAGHGGRINLDVRGFASSQTQEEVLSATAGQPELSGSVTVAAAQVNLAASLDRLSTSLDAELPLATDRCAYAGDTAQSSLTEGSRLGGSCEPAAH